MTTLPPRAGAAGPGDVADRLFGEVLESLAVQLERARRGDVDAVADLACRTSDALARARREGLRPDPECRRRMLDLHDRIALALAQQKDEVARARVRLARGTRSLRAYRDASG